MRKGILIVYSHSDRRWLKIFEPHFRLIERVLSAPIATMDDTAIWSDTGESVATFLASAKVCVLLASPHLLASDLMREAALPSLLADAAAEGVAVTWIPLSAAAYESSEIYKYQAASDPSRPLDTLPASRRNKVITDIVLRVESLLEPKRRPAAEGTTAASPRPAAAESRPAEETAEPPRAGAEAQRTFVCYAREDAEFVLTLASDLKAAGVNVWLDQWDIPSGADWDFEIDKALYDCRHFLIVLSPEAVNSEEVRSELRTALNERKRIVPVLYKACRIPRRLTLIQYTDFTSAGADHGAALRQIVQALG